MGFASLQDYNGEIELTFFSGPWAECRDKIENDKVSILKGKLDYQQHKDKYSFLVDECLGEAETERLSSELETQNRKWDKYRNIWKYAAELDLSFPDLANPATIKPGTYTVIGAVTSLRTHVDKKGKEMAFGTLQDSQGETDLVFFARSWENCKALVTVDEIIALKGSIEAPKDSNTKLAFIVSSIQDINKLLRGAAKKAAEIPNNKAPSEATASSDATIHIRLAARAADNEDNIYTLKNCLEGNTHDLLPTQIGKQQKIPVYIYIPVSPSAGGTGKETVIRTESQINTDISASVGALAKCEAVADVWVA
jgi:DNA polymerase-3 subunit alpha